MHTLQIEHFRCITHAVLHPHPGINLLYGDNASGKTSLLEAIYFLGRARSFRTARIAPLIQEGADTLMVAGNIAPGRHLGIRRGRGGDEIRLGGEVVRSLAELSAAFPVQALDPTVHGLLEDGPRPRRRFLDWGLFHVEQGFQSVWQRYNRALRQRNALLRLSAPRNEFIHWEQELTESGQTLDRARRRYLERLVPVVLGLAEDLLDLGTPIRLDYQPGWPAGRTLGEALEQGWAQDKVQGATRNGPHRADFVIRLGEHRAQERVSRGQQKVLAGALVLGQMRCHHETLGRPAVLLVDDLPAELDAAHLSRFLTRAGDGHTQLFLTSIRPESIPADLLTAGQVFHVKQGEIHANG